MPISRHLTFANLASGLALAVALGTGTSYAAEHVKIPKASVGTKQLQNNAVTGAKIKDASIESADLGAGTVTGNQLAPGAVTGAKVADGTLTTADLATTSLAQLALGKPRAYGIISATGTLLGGSGATVAQVADGICVTPTAASGASTTTDPIVATADGMAGPAFVQTLGFNDGAGVVDCPSSSYFLLVESWTGTDFTTIPAVVSFVIQ